MLKGSSFFYGTGVEDMVSWDRVGDFTMLEDI